MKKSKLLFTSLAVMTLGLSACKISLPSIFDDVTKASKYVDSVVLDTTYYSLEIGQQVTLLPTVTMKEGHENDEYNTMWKSSRPNVAKVENGVVTTLAAGSASISFVAGLKMASCTVVVHGGSENPTYDQDQASAVTVSISIASKTIAVDDEFTLMASASDGSAIAWKSLDSGVATVSNSGLVKGISAGTTDIVAYSGEASAKCRVTVNDGSVTPPEPGPEEDDKTCTVYFFIDYNNIDENDTTGTKLLATFKWYENIPIGQSGLVPADPTTPLDPAFPYFVGWSSHTIIDSADDLWDIDNDVIGSEHFFYLYAIWSDVPKGGFVK